jgi:phage terminase large subunit GpA-like protein
VQGGKHRRFVCQVHAIGDAKRQWVVDRFDITTFMDSEGRQIPIKPNLHHEHWNELNKQILDKWYKDEDGVYLKVAAMACDSNGEAGVTQNAYEYYRNASPEYKSRIYLVKGASSEQEKLVEKYKPKHTVDRTKRKAKKRGNVPLLMLNTNKLKDIVSRNMQVEAGLPLSMMYSHELEDSFYSELMAEKRNTAGKWIHESGANEAFDLCVYVWALMVLKGLVELEEFTRPLAFTKLSKDEPDKKPITRKRRRR